MQYTTGLFKQPAFTRLTSASARLRPIARMSAVRIREPPSRRDTPRPITQKHGLHLAPGLSRRQRRSEPDSQLCLPKMTCMVAQRVKPKRVMVFSIVVALVGHLLLSCCGDSIKEALLFALTNPMMPPTSTKQAYLSATEMLCRCLPVFPTFSWAVDAAKIMLQFGPA